LLRAGHGTSSRPKFFKAGGVPFRFTATELRQCWMFFPSATRLPGPEQLRSGGCVAKTRRIAEITKRVFWLENHLQGDYGRVAVGASIWYVKKGRRFRGRVGRHPKNGTDNIVMDGRPVITRGP